MVKEYGDILKHQTYDLIREIIEASSFCVWMF
jgi:hypothetical protein